MFYNQHKVDTKVNIKLEGDRRSKERRFTFFPYIFMGKIGFVLKWRF